MLVVRKRPTPDQDDAEDYPTFDLAGRIFVSSLGLLCIHQTKDKDSDNEILHITSNYKAVIRRDKNFRIQLKSNFPNLCKNSLLLSSIMCPSVSKKLSTKGRLDKL